MKKRYKFAARGMAWSKFIDQFAQELEKHPELDHIGWEATYTGGVGVLVVDYGGDIDVVVDHKLADGHWFRW